MPCLVDTVINVHLADRNLYVFVPQHNTIAQHISLLL